MALITEDEYNYAGGCGVLHPFDKKKREACEKANLTAKTTEKQSDVLLAQAALNKSLQKDEQMSPLAITGIIVGSLLAITVMVVVIKKVRK